MNIKYAILSFLGVVLYTCLPAQHLQYSDLRRYVRKYEILDSAKLRITYNLSYIPDTNNLTKINKDRKILLIGDQYTHFYSYYIWQSDSVLTTDMNRGNTSRQPKQDADVYGEGYELYTNFIDQKRITIEPITSYSVYKYTESLEPINWEITADTKRILDYKCQKAIGYCGGRTYQVWFSSEIPIAMGPWKLDGLPGLILEASDTKKQYMFECIGIEPLKVKEPIMMSEFNYINVSKKDYKKAQKRFYDNYADAMLAMGVTLMLIDDDGNLIRKIDTPNRVFLDQKMMFGRAITTKEYLQKKRSCNLIEIE